MENGKHPNKVVGYNDSLEQLAKEVGNMSYDQTALFIEELAKDLERQANADAAKGRKKLAQRLSAAAENLAQVRREIMSAWKICQPHMKSNHKI
jgi:hypothetical protein